MAPDYREPALDSESDQGDRERAFCGFRYRDVSNAQFAPGSSGIAVASAESSGIYLGGDLMLPEVKSVS
jgi:hypothetical protein